MHITFAHDDGVSRNNSALRLLIQTTKRTNKKNLQEN